MLSGWTPTETHHIERDADGVTEVVVTRDSEWDDEQIALLIAVKGLSAEIGPHGQPMDEAMSTLADPFQRQPGGYRYVAHVRRDHAQQALATAQADRAAKYPEADLSADIWTVEKVFHD